MNESNVGLKVLKTGVATFIKDNHVHVFEARYQENLNDFITRAKQEIKAL